MTYQLNENTLNRLDESIDLEHPWVTKYRVAPVEDLFPSWSFIACLATGDSANTLDNFLQPTDADAAIVGAYIDYYKSYWYGASYLQKLALYPVDLDGGVNTTSFALTEKGWVYRKSTWRDQPQAPYRNAEKQYPTILELIDHLETFGDESTPHERWVAYKAAHNIVG